MQDSVLLGLQASHAEMGVGACLWGNGETRVNKPRKSARGRESTAVWKLAISKT